MSVYTLTTRACRHECVFLCDSVHAYVHKSAYVRGQLQMGVDVRSTSHSPRIGLIVD